MRCICWVRVWQQCCSCLLQRTTLRDLPSTTNSAALPWIIIIQARRCLRILPGLWTMGTPCSLGLMSKTRPEMTAEYKILSLALGNVTVCPGFPTKYLDNLMTQSYAVSIVDLLEVRAHNKGKNITLHLTSQPEECVHKLHQDSYTFLCRWLRKIPNKIRFIFLSFNRSL